MSCEGGPGQSGRNVLLSVDMNLRPTVIVSATASGHDCATVCSSNADNLGASLASRPRGYGCLLRLKLVVVRDVTRIRVMWEKFPGVAQ